MRSLLPLPALTDNRRNVFNFQIATLNVEDSGCVAKLYPIST
jgi:hypothetical protein